MAHFARVENGLVFQVIVVNNVDILDVDGNESEAVGQAFINSIGLDGEWVQTSYNGNPVGGVDRGPYAGIGYSWDGDKFAAPAVPEPAPEEIPAP
jgi:hypothetical protein